MRKAIFNSVGSNYTLRSARRALFARNNDIKYDQLVELLASRYGGETHLFYKGREAIQAALVVADLPKNTKVLITGYTCYAVYKAVIDADCIPVFVNIATSELNFSAETLQKALTKNPDATVVIIQNTLGYPTEIKGVQAIAKKNGLLLIEDLAHCIGMQYSDGDEAGTIGDFVTLSFSQDKVIDGVSGGALVVRNKAFKNRAQHMIAYSKLPRMQQLRDRIYPLLTVKIRTLYPYGLGKPLHALCKKLHLLAKPVDGIFGVYRELAPWYAGLAYDQYTNLEQIAEHRALIGKVYSKVIPKNYQVSSSHGNAIFLRFPLLIENRETLFTYLKKSNIFITDIWYETPIAPARYLSKTIYKDGICPAADKVAKQMVNLPTHINVSEADAMMIAGKVLEWLSQA